MGLRTPLGEIIVSIDEKEIDYNYYKIKNNDRCKDLLGRYLINICFKCDGIEHTISCCIKDYKKTIKDDIETGENLELKSFFKDNIKLSIGMEGDTGSSERDSNYYEYDNEYLDNGVEYKILKNTSDKVKNYIFVIAWIENFNSDNDVQTWFGADPSDIRMDDFLN